MSEPQGDNFDDPGLKAAVGRAWGAERCPPALRERLIAECGGPPSMKIGDEQPKLGRRLIFYGWMAAALMLIAVGLVFYLHPPAPNDRGLPPVALTLPASVADELIARHDECCKAEDHHMPGLSRDDFPTIARELRQRLGFPILAARLPGTWEFRGASICPVGETKSGHLVFDRGNNEFVSIFSLPRQFLSAIPSGKEFSEVELRHPIAGFATGEGFYCIVGSSKTESLSLEQVRSFRDQLRSDIANAEVHPSRATVAALR